LVFAIAAMTLSACGGGSEDVVYRYPTESTPETAAAPPVEEPKDEGMFGTDIFADLFGEGDATAPAAAPPDSDVEVKTGIGVNPYLWRASLDALAFMPLASADPFGGTIITDWYSPPEAPNEQFKVTVYILDRALRADGIRVQVFRQERDAKTGEWANAPVAPDTTTKLENAILSRARELRVATVEE
jgi:hypothetical protein